MKNTSKTPQNSTPLSKPQNSLDKRSLLHLSLLFLASILIVGFGFQWGYVKLKHKERYYGKLNQPKKEWTPFIALTIAHGSLRDWDEAWYAQISKEVYRSENYLFLRYEDRLWFDKPPLSFWVTCLFYKLFGIHEASARLFSVCCGIGTILLCTLIGWYFFRWEAGLLAGWLMLTFGHFLQYARRGQTDVPVTFFITLTLFFFLKGIHHSSFFWLAGVAFGAALMTKGSIALFAAFIAFLYLAFTKQWGILKKASFWGGIVLAFALALPWHLYQYFHYPDAFMQHYFGDHLGRLIEAPGEAETRPFYFYFKDLPDNFRPWFLFVYPLMLWSLWRVISSWSRGEKENMEKGECFALSWIVVVFGVLTIASTKSPWYIIPIYPGFAFLLAYWFDQIPKSKKRLGILLFVIIFLVMPSVSRKVRHIQYNPEIKLLAPAIHKWVPSEEKLLVYDDPTRDKHTSIFPPSTLFYGDRFLDWIRDNPQRLRKELELKQRACLISTYTLKRLKDFSFEVLAQQKHLCLIRWKKKESGSD